MNNLKKRKVRGLKKDKNALFTAVYNYPTRQVYTYNDLSLKYICILEVNGTISAKYLETYLEFYHKIKNIIFSDNTIKRIAYCSESGTQFNIFLQQKKNGDFFQQVQELALKIKKEMLPDKIDVKITHSRMLDENYDRTIYPCFEFNEQRCQYWELEKMQHIFRDVIPRCSYAELYYRLKQNNLCNDVIKHIIFNYGILDGELLFERYTLNLTNYYTKPSDQREKIKKNFFSLPLLEQLQYSDSFGAKNSKV